jgi:tetratricopeptide (TPR) repeat protein
MRLMARITLIVLLLIAGAAAGAYLALRYAESKSRFDERMDVMHFSAYLSAQRSEGTDAAYEEALKAFLLVLDKRQGNWSPTWPDSVYAVDRALTYARLAMLARKRGAEKEAAEYTDQSVALCPRMGWQTCSGEQIAAAAARLDKTALSGRASSEPKK